MGQGALLLNLLQAQHNSACALLSSAFDRE